MRLLSQRPVPTVVVIIITVIMAIITMHSHRFQFVKKFIARAKPLDRKHQPSRCCLAAFTAALQPFIARRCV
jgi:hypothetical protein